MLSIFLKYTKFHNDVFVKIISHCTLRSAKKIALSKTYRKWRRVNERWRALRALRVVTQLCYSRILKRNLGEKWGKYKINKNIENSRRSSYHLQRSLTHRQLPSKHFEQHFFFMRSMAFLSYKQGYFWNATASSSSWPRIKEVFLFLVLVIFRFYTLSLVFLYLIFFLFRKKNFLQTEIILLTDSEIGSL